jgi:signal transduction histidine kinase
MILNILKKSWVYVTGVFFVTTISLIVTWFLVANDGTNKLNILNKINSQTQFNGISTVLNVIPPLINFGTEFMKDFTIYNSTIEQYTRLSNLNQSSVGVYISNIRIFYNISDLERPHFESKLSNDLGKNVSISDFSGSDIIKSPQRSFYCPATYTSPYPYNNLTNPWIPGFDICNSDVFVDLINRLQNADLYETIIQPRIQLISGATILYYATRVPNGVVAITLSPENIFWSIKKYSDIDTTLLFNNKIFYNTCGNGKCTGYNFSKNISIFNSLDVLTVNLYYNNKLVSYDTFYYIAAAFLLLSVLAVSIIINLAYRNKKFEIANEMLAYVNHEIRNPLNCISGMLEIILLDLLELKIEMPEIISNAHTAKNACTLLNHVVNDILDYQKITDNKLKIFNNYIKMADLEKMLCNTINPKLWEKPQLEYTFDNGGIEEIYTDESRIIQILLNFLTNAIKFTDKGHVKVFITKNTVNHTITFNVEDTGRGIASDDKSKLFQPYRQTGVIDSLRHGGIGLGLYLCKMLSVLMEGSVGYTSVLGKGSTFYITIPDRPSLPSILVI